MKKILFLLISIFLYWPIVSGSSAEIPKKDADIEVYIECYGEKMEAHNIYRATYNNSSITKKEGELDAPMLDLKESEKSLIQAMKLVQAKSADKESAKGAAVSNWTMLGPCSEPIYSIRQANVSSRWNVTANGIVTCKEINRWWERRKK